MPRTRLRVWFVTVCAAIVAWTCLVQLIAFGRLWRHRSGGGASSAESWDWNPTRILFRFGVGASDPSPAPSPLPPPRLYTSNGYLTISCNGGLNQMRSAICDMVTVARLLNLTLVVPELDKTSFWADSRMRPVSWSDDKYYLQQNSTALSKSLSSYILQILPLFNKFKVIHFNKTDARLANNGLPLELQKLRCRVNFHALKFTPQIEEMGNKLVQILQQRGFFVALHLRYEMDMLAFSGCTYAYPWWREKEINSEAKRLQGLCPLTPEETTLILKALGFDKNTQIYIAAGETYGGERRLKELQTAFPNLGILEVPALAIRFDEPVERVLVSLNPGSVHPREDRLCLLEEAASRERAQQGIVGLRGRGAPDLVHRVESNESLLVQRRLPVSLDDSGVRLGAGHDPSGGHVGENGLGVFVEPAPAAGGDDALVGLHIGLHILLQHVAEQRDHLPEVAPLPENCDQDVVGGGVGGRAADLHLQEELADVVVAAAAAVEAEQEAVGGGGGGAAGGLHLAEHGDGLAGGAPAGVGLDEDVVGVGVVAGEVAAGGHLGEELGDAVEAAGGGEGVDEAGVGGAVGGDAGLEHGAEDELGLVGEGAGGGGGAEDVL
ncbi:Uncharacterized protein ACMD2_19919 [Ananas comosus]|uniref:O-fucosyltransferase family protein n=1 Tax=Ananas comosus TaxID=4615 RepID=A0A199VUQ2_ANACO|nr:Uncharacterized protein ACMD2_19919 [Ananas comosus]